VRRCLAKIAIVCLTVLSWPLAGASQEQTRDGERAAAQSAKATELRPYVPSAAERWIERGERLVLDPAVPVLPFIGSVFPGGGLAMGPVLRRSYGDSGLFTARGAWSVRNYLAADAGLFLPSTAHGRVQPSLHASWLRAPTVRFFGIGPDSRDADETAFFTRTTTLGGSARLRTTPTWAVGVGVDYFELLSNATDPDRFGIDVLAGLNAAVTYVVTRAFVEADTRPAPGYATAGSFGRFDWSRYAAQRGGPHSFTRVDGEAVHLIPFARASRVVALRAAASFTQVAAGQTVPFFLLPALGGGRSLRGYSDWRFRDRHRLLMSAEYRWPAGRYVDMALFSDAGTVAARPAELERFATSFGAGVRFHAPAATVLRAEIARTGDGIGFVLAFGAPF
jgi:hypothetical protein